ncbi:MAG: hypothetical protein PWQ88_144 [Candidatus Methanomethylophilaceae archaeon]|nr:hypothetical protein [Candidatus Methanomethylophilaceae archaeon]MDI3541717.1 hypothetical protein [Candidatus Methanomethylophilaceae archaeon]
MQEDISWRGEGDLNPRVLFGQWISSPSPYRAGPSPQHCRKRDTVIKALYTGVCSVRTASLAKML